MAERWPDVGVLELLVAVGTTGSLSAAAREVGMAQPNASRAIRTLERDLGISLLHRTPTGSRLTGEGALVAEWGARVIDPMRQLLLAAGTLRRGARARLSVASSRTIAEYAVPGWLTLLRAEHPDLQVTLHVDNSTAVHGRVAAGSCDLGFVEGPGVPAGLHSVVVGVDELLVVVATSHPWARRRRPVTPADLAATPLVVREVGSGTRDTLDRQLAAFAPVAPALVLGSNEAVRISVAAGAGPAVLSELAVRSSLGTHQLVAVPAEGLRLRRRLRAVWSEPSALRGPAADLVRIARTATRRPSP